MLNKWISIFVPMKLYSIHQTHQLPISQKEAWAFLSSADNLSKIMPDDMHFEVQSKIDKPIYPGQLIEYKVTPFRGFTTKWVTEINHVQEPHYFVDTQLVGPYKIWHHTHILHPNDEGVLIEDQVRYQMPFGILGELVHPILVQPQLNKIFKAREEKMNELFSKKAEIK